MIAHRAEITNQFSPFRRGGDPDDFMEHQVVSRRGKSRPASAVAGAHGGARRTPATFTTCSILAAWREGLPCRTKDSAWSSICRQRKANRHTRKFRLHAAALVRPVTRAGRIPMRQISVIPTGDLMTHETSPGSLLIRGWGSLCPVGPARAKRAGRSCGNPPPRMIKGHKVAASRENPEHLAKSEKSGEQAADHAEALKKRSS